MLVNLPEVMVARQSPEAQRALLNVVKETMWNSTFVATTISRFEITSAGTFGW
jgi:hypothetical protein